MGGLSQLRHQLLVQLSVDITVYIRIVGPFGMEPSEGALMTFSKVACGSSFHCNAMALTLANVVNSLLRGVQCLHY